MDVELLPAKFDDKPLLQRMMQLYQYDFSEFDGSDLNVHGLYGYSYLDNYWTEAMRHPFLIRVNGQLAGFALVRQLASAPKVEWSLAEFFVMRKYRRMGVGRQVARSLFANFSGIWQLDILKSNVGAEHFWRSVVGEYTAGSYIERQADAEWDGLVFQFDLTQPDRQP